MILLPVLFLGLLLLCPELALAGSRYGTTLWLSQLLPTLLPFFIAIRLFDSCLPQVSGRRAFLLTGILCGYPAGASLVTAQYDRGLLSRDKAFFYLGFVNNPSPMFVLVFCGSTVLGLSSRECLLLFGLLLLSSLAGSFLFLAAMRIPLPVIRRFASLRHAATRPGMAPPAPGPSGESLSQCLDRVILDSFVTLARIGGYVVIFSILGQCMNHLLHDRPTLSVLCSGLLEITSGTSCLRAASLPLCTKKALMIAILSFGGLSAAAQTGSILSRSELSILPYLIIKATSGLLAFLLTVIL